MRQIAVSVTDEEYEILKQESDGMSKTIRRLIDQNYAIVPEDERKTIMRKTEFEKMLRLMLDKCPEDLTNEITIKEEDIIRETGCGLRTRGFINALRNEFDVENIPMIARREVLHSVRGRIVVWKFYFSGGDPMLDIKAMIDLLEREDEKNGK